MILVGHPKGEILKLTEVNTINFNGSLTTETSRTNCSFLIWKMPAIIISIPQVAWRHWNKKMHIKPHGQFLVHSKCPECSLMWLYYLEPDNLECQVNWALGSITTNKASGCDTIPVELFQILKDDAVKVLHSMSANLGNPAVAAGLEKVSFHSNPKERQCQRMLRLPNNWTHLALVK